MNRNAVVGVAILGVALSGVSIGSATYLSSRSVEATSQRLSSDLREEADKREELSSRTDARQNTLLAIKGGEAESLAAKGEGYALWSRGRFVVSNPAAGDIALFEVDPAAASVASSGDLGVGGRLVVADAVDAAEMEATGRVSGASLATGGFAVDSQGDMTASSLTLASNANICGDLVVKGSRIEFGPSIGEDPALGFSSDPASGKWALAVHGAIKAREMDIIDNGVFAAGNGSFRIDSSGATTVGGELEVSGPATFSGTFVVGDMQAERVSIGGQLTAAGAEFTGEVAAESARLSDRLTAPDGIFERSLAVSGPATFHTLAATSADLSGAVTADNIALRGGVDAENITARGNVRANDAAFEGDVGAGRLAVSGGVSASEVKVGGKVAAASASLTGTLSATDANVSGGVVAGGRVKAGSLVVSAGISASDGGFVVDGSGGVSAGALVVADDLSAADGRFVVDPSGGTRIDGSLTVGADATFSSAISVSGDATFGAIHAGPITSGSVTSDGLLATSGDVRCDRFIAARRIALSNDSFVVSADGDVTAAGSLTVAGNVSTAGSLTVAGDVTAIGSLHVAGPSAVEGGLCVNGGFVLNGRSVDGLASGSVSLASTGTVAFPSEIPSTAKFVFTPTSSTDGDGDWWVTGRTLYSEGARSFDWIATW